MIVVVAALAAVTLAAAPPPNDAGPLPTLDGVTNVSRVEPRLSTAATRIAGLPAEVRCWSPDDWARLDREWTAHVGTGVTQLRGYTRRSDPLRIQLAPNVCADLAGFIYAKDRPAEPRDRARLAAAIQTLAHEAQHLGGIRDEAQAECWGAQRIRPLARMLGSSKNYAAALAVAWWRFRRPAPGSALWSGECRNGGQLDINPRSSAWP